MADEVDKANDLADELIRRAIAYTSTRKEDTVATGFCLNCAEDVPDGVRWCSSECRDDWTKRKRVS